MRTAEENVRDDGGFFSKKKILWKIPHWWNSLFLERKNLIAVEEKMRAVMVGSLAKKALNYEASFLWKVHGCSKGICARSGGLFCKKGPYSR